MGWSKTEKWIIAVCLICMLSFAGHIMVPDHQPVPRQESKRERIERIMEQEVTSPAAQARLRDAVRLSQEKTDAAWQRVREAEEKLRLAQERVDRAFSQ